jgi:hypothetical protein
MQPESVDQARWPKRSDLHSGGDQLESRSGHPLTELRTFVVFLYARTQLALQLIKLGHTLLNSLFTLDAIQSELLTACLNKLQINKQTRMCRCVCRKYTHKYVTKLDNYLQLLLVSEPG